MSIDRDHALRFPSLALPIPPFIGACSSAVTAGFSGRRLSNPASKGFNLGTCYSCIESVNKCTCKRYHVPRISRLQTYTSSSAPLGENNPDCGRRKKREQRGFIVSKKQNISLGFILAFLFCHFNRAFD